MAAGSNRGTIGMIVIAVLLTGVGYLWGQWGRQELREDLQRAVAENVHLKEQARQIQQRNESLEKESMAWKQQERLIPSLEPFTLDAIKGAGITDPELLLESLRQNPGVIPEGAVLGGTMQFTRIGIIDSHWVYGAYEDGHIAGAAVFQWEIQDSRINWTPILVWKE